MDERAQRIVDTAIELAEQNGYAAVRLRDIATKAGVALGTVYNRFASKEEILVAVMAAEGERLFESMSQGVEGSTPRARAEYFFVHATAAFLARPNLARAVLRSLVGGGDIAVHVLGLQKHTTRLLMKAIAGDDSPDDEELEAVATILQQVWFASLIGWTSGLYATQDDVVAHVHRAARRLLS
ncbi:MAG: TetR/AcrR family transcriptional regulator [Polyangiales bacterium]